MSTNYQAEHNVWTAYIKKLRPINPNANQFRAWAYTQGLLNKPSRGTKSNPNLFLDPSRKKRYPIPTVTISFLQKNFKSDFDITPTAIKIQPERTKPLQWDKLDTFIGPPPHPRDTSSRWISGPMPYPNKPMPSSSGGPVKYATPPSSPSYSPYNSPYKSPYRSPIKPVPILFGETQIDKTLDEGINFDDWMYLRSMNNHQDAFEEYRNILTKNQLLKNKRAVKRTKKDYDTRQLIINYKQH